MTIQAAEQLFSRTLDFANKHSRVASGASAEKLVPEERSEFVKDGFALMEAIDLFKGGQITLEDYFDRSLAQWGALGRYRSKISAQAQILSSVPSAILAGLLSDIPDMFPELGLKVGTEIKSVVGIYEDGSPITKDQDVAIYFTKDGKNVAIKAWEVKENYIDKTMLAGTQQTAAMGRAIHRYFRMEVMTPGLNGGKEDRNAKLRILCPTQKGRNPLNRLYDTSVFAAIRADTISHLAEMDHSMIDEWTLPSHDQFVLEKVMIDLEGRPEAIRLLKERMNNG